MVLIAGLGNPGKKYEKTRHNIGFRVVDEISKIKKEGWILLKPNTFMNQSGKAIKSHFHLNNTMVGLRRVSGKSYDNLWVIHDDIDLPLSTFKISFGRGSAGHKGVQSIINELKTKDFWRVRVGICPKTGKPKNVEKFVLQKFSKSEEKILKETIKKVIAEIDELTN